MPRWILTRAGGPHAGRSRDEWRRLMQEGVPEGQRNSTVVSLTGYPVARDGYRGGIGTDAGLEPPALPSTPRRRRSRAGRRQHVKPHEREATVPARR